MKIAFLIAAHAHPELLVRLIERLRGPEFSIFLHLDRNSDAASFKAALEAHGFHDVQWVPRVVSAWGTFGQVEASLSLLETAIERDPSAEMFVLLSGQDYPLQTPQALSEFFASRPGVNFIRWAKLPWSSWKDDGGFERLTHFHFMVGGWRLEYPSKLGPCARRLKFAYWLCKLLLPTRRELPENIEFYGGFNWWSFTRRTCQLLLEYLRQNPKFFKTFKFTRSSDEIFFQTALFDLPEEPALEDNDLRCVFWDGRHHEFPAYLREEDFEEIVASNAFFARKVHPTLSRGLLDRIDAELLGWAPREVLQ